MDHKEFHGYHRRYNNILDLEKIDVKMESGSYKTKEEFETDLRTMISNAMNFFPPTSQIFKDARSFDRLLNREWNRIFMIPTVPKRQKAPLPWPKIPDNCTGLNSTDMQKCRRIYKKLSGRKIVLKYFNAPADPVDLPGYYDRVKDPMDFETVHIKLNRNAYNDVAEFERDVRLVYQNCRLYHGPVAWISRQVDELEETFDRDWLGKETEELHTLGGLTEEEYLRCRKVWKKMIVRDEALHFAVPVPRENEAFYKNIKEPMDFAKLDIKLIQGQYKTVAEFEKDIRLLFNNAYKMHREDSFLGQQAKELEKAFIREWYNPPDRLRRESGRIPLTLAVDDDIVGGSTIAQAFGWSYTEDGDKCRRCVNRIKSHKFSEPFRNPARREANPNYYDIVSDPVDLSLMEERLNSGAYQSSEDVFNDMKLLFQNSYRYYGFGSQYMRQAEVLEKLFEEVWLASGLEAPEGGIVKFKRASALETRAGDPSSHVIADHWEAIDVVLDKVRRAERAIIFLRPHDRSKHSSLYRIDPNPMDLAQVTEKFDSGAYIKFEELVDDMDRIVDVGLRYYASKTEGYECSRLLKRKWSEEWKAFITGIPVKPRINDLIPKAALSDADRQNCWKVLNAIKSHENSWPFLEPVLDEVAPGYSQIIKYPMDLTTIQKKLERKQYNAALAFFNDCKQIFVNCRMYNASGSAIADIADRLERTFDNKWEDITGMDVETSVQSIATDLEESGISTRSGRKRKATDEEEFTPVPVKAEAKPAKRRREDVLTPVPAGIPSPPVVMEPPRPTIFLPKIKLTARIPKLPPPVAPSDSEAPHINLLVAKEEPMLIAKQEPQPQTVPAYASMPPPSSALSVPLVAPAAPAVITSLPPQSPASINQLNNGKAPAAAPAKVIPRIKLKLKFGPK